MSNSRAIVEIMVSQINSTAKGIADVMPGLRIQMGEAFLEHEIKLGQNGAFGNLVSGRIHIQEKTRLYRTQIEGEDDGVDELSPHVDDIISIEARLGHGSDDYVEILQAAELHVEDHLTGGSYVFHSEFSSTTDGQQLRWLMEKPTGIEKRDRSMPYYTYELVLPQAR